MHSITKSFDFCYGHRVWSQTLDPALSCNAPCKCRHLHGHQGKVTVKLMTHKLKDGMVTDFHHLAWFKEFLDDYLDHKMIFDENDPFLPNFLMGYSVWPDQTNTLSPWATAYFEPLPIHGSNLDTYTLKYFPQHSLDLNKTPLEKEILEGMVLVNFIPTSENIAAFLYTVIEVRMNGKFSGWIKSVEFNETPKTSAVFEAP